MKKLIVVIIFVLIILKIMFTSDVPDGIKDDNATDVKEIFETYVDNKYPDKKLEVDMVIDNSIKIVGMRVDLPRFLTEYNSVVEDKEDVNKSFKINYKVRTRNIKEDHKDVLIVEKKPENKTQKQLKEYLSPKVKVDKKKSIYVAIEPTEINKLKNKLTEYKSEDTLMSKETEIQIEKFIEKNKVKAKKNLVSYLENPDKLVEDMDKVTNVIEGSQEDIFKIVNMKNLTGYNVSMKDTKTNDGVYVEIKRPFNLNSDSVIKLLNVLNITEEVSRNLETGEFKQIVIDNEEVQFSFTFAK